MVSEAWQNELKPGDAVEADHPFDEGRIHGTYTQCYGSRFCTIKCDDGEHVVAYRGLIRKENDDETT